MIAESVDTIENSSFKGPGSILMGYFFSFLNSCNALLFIRFSILLPAR